MDEKLPDFTEREDGGGEIFFDVSAINSSCSVSYKSEQPNVLSTDGTAAITATAFSRDGKYFSYGISLSGSDFFTVYVRKCSDPFRAVGDKRPDMDDGVLDIIRYVKFSSIVWTHENKGFFYQVCEYSSIYSFANPRTLGVAVSGSETTRRHQIRRCRN
jgi:prolyl oligopeptidase